MTRFCRAGGFGPYQNNSRPCNQSAPKHPLYYLQPALSSGFPNSVSQRLGAYSEDSEKAFMHGPQTALTMFLKIELR